MMLLLSCLQWGIKSGHIKEKIKQKHNSTLTPNCDTDCDDDSDTEPQSTGGVQWAEKPGASTTRRILNLISHVSACEWAAVHKVST